MNSSRWNRVAAVLLTGALFATACGGDGGETTVAGPDGTTPPVDSSTPTPEPPPTPEPTPDPGEGDHEALAALDQARARWASAGITDYSYSIVEACECDEETSGPRRIVVQSGEVVATTWFGTPSSVEGFTVEQLFDQIETELYRPDTQNAVIYDPDTGYPLEASLDIVGQQVDGGRFFQMQGFIDYGDLRDGLAEARSTWAASGIDTYVLTYDQVCFCPELQVQVTVVDGEVVGTEFRSDVDFGDLPALTVDDMFAVIEDAIDTGAFAITVDYDPETGHPTGYFVDVEEMMADEEFGISDVTLDVG